MNALPKIDKKLNIVHKVDDGEGNAVEVHAACISRFVFEQYFLLISKTYTALYTEGLLTTGPRVSMNMLKTIAVNMGPKVWEDAQKGLINEIQRLANIIVRDPAGVGWTTVPLYGAVDRGLISSEDLDEINSVLVFFTCASCMHTRSQIAGILLSMRVWGTLTTLLNATEYASSLPTLTEDEIGRMAPTAPLSVPS